MFHSSPWEAHHACFLGYLSRSSRIIRLVGVKSPGKPYTYPAWARVILSVPSVFLALFGLAAFFVSPAPKPASYDA